MDKTGPISNTPYTHVNLLYPDNSFKSVELENVVHELYYNLATINKSKYSSIELIAIKKIISHFEDFIPLYDIYSKNLYLVNSSNVFSRVTKYHYRLPHENIIKKIKKTIKSIKSTSMQEYIEKLGKNITFLENYDLHTLEKTYYKLFYLSQPKIQEITTCLKPSFVPFITKNPYYSKSELINMALNMNLQVMENMDNLCSQVSENDINSTIILSHQIYIKNSAKSYIQLYTLLGSYYWNYYIRKEPSKDINTELQIERLYQVIRESPEFDKSYYLYRFIDNDDYLKHLTINSIFKDESFISTTRNPFYDTKNNIFGFIMIKIIIPGNVKGIGLCVESYSLFSEEEEILLGPCNLKLISIENNFKYYHPDKNASKRIQKLYIFEYIEKIPMKNFDKYMDQFVTIPRIDWLNGSSNGDDFTSKVYHFYSTVLPPINNKRYFYSNIGKQTYLFHVFYLDNNPIYEKYFFLQKNTNNNPGKEEIYFILHDDVTGEIILLVEIRDVISVNYIHRFIGTPPQPYTNEELILFVSSVAHYFNVNQVIIHDVYKSYLTISTNLLKNQNESIFAEENPDNHIISLFAGDFKYYNEHIINHIEKKNDRFNNIPGVVTNLKPYHFGQYIKLDALTIFNDTVKSPLYNILLKINKVNKITYLLDFYIYIHYNFFYLIKELDMLIINYNKEFSATKIIPWTDSYTVLNSEEYLFETKKITFIRTFKSDVYKNYLKKLSDEHKNISFNKFRLGLL